MFEIITSQTKKYRMVDAKKNQTVYFNTFEEMLEFVAKGCTTRFFQSVNSYNNIYLDFIDLTGYDYAFVYKYDMTKKDFIVCSEKCIYMFFDKDDNVLDLRTYSKNIHKRYLAFCRRKRDELAPEYTFRRGPVPGTGVCYHSFSLRHPKTYNEKRLNATPEYKDYIRTKRKPNYLPDVYDDIFIRPEKSWKDKTKSRKSWAKHEKAPLKRNYEKFKKEISD